MKRVLLATGGTVAGVAALLAAKSGGHPLGPTGGLPSAALGDPASTAPGGSVPSSTGPAPASSGPPAAGARTVTGAAVDTQYGVVQVRITVSGGKITHAAFVQLTAFDGQSQAINSYAGPILLQETLSAQSANVDTVSGASYTSDGYRQSLQSALDKAGIR